MNINAGIIDQQLSGLLEKHPKWFSAGADDQNRSTAFVLLCMARCLDIPLADARDLLTDGGNDAGVDGLHIDDVESGEFLITVFQGKYKIRNLDGDANFPENGVQKAVNTTQLLFDPSRPVTLNERLAPKVEEIRSLIRDGYMPRVRFVLCNNGAQWNEIAQEWIDELKRDFPDKVEFHHFNHDSIVRILQKAKEVDATLQFSGQLIVEDMNYLRVLVGRLDVRRIAELFEQHGDHLLQRNIRRYLGSGDNRVNAAICDTLISPEADRFYCYNNGITMVCDKFDYNAFQKNDYQVQLSNLQIINGGQTCRAIHETLGCLPEFPVFETAFVMVRVYQLAADNKDLVQDITYATNSQTPVDLRDLRSNDELQRNLELGMEALGFSYRCQRDEASNNPGVITSPVAAAAALAVWREKPHQGKMRKAHFGRLYEEIFQGLNAAQAALAVLIFRYAENKRKRPTRDDPPAFLPYASHYLAMLAGRELLREEGISLAEVSHWNYKELERNFLRNEAAYYDRAVQKVEDALRRCYGEREVSLQQLAATFRRGDLLEMLGAGS